MGGEGIAGMGRSGACRYNRMRTLSKSDTPFMYIDYIKEKFTNRAARVPLPTTQQIDYSIETITNRVASRRM
ncbi:MAG: hypothetical protein HLUCCA01_13775 [Bacteroidetes bacterium HLUCCA01]|nr:MAG: hypothetical protein HLUCCA01_13775 [Bacteroidetes bacterium HLUCCA01]